MSFGLDNGFPGRIAAAYAGSRVMRIGIEIPTALRHLLDDTKTRIEFKVIPAR